MTEAGDEFRLYTMGYVFKICSIPGLSAAEEYYYAAFDARCRVGRAENWRLAALDARVGCCA